MAHHLVSEHDQKAFCIYCKNEVPPTCWISEWDSEKHYKICPCPHCNKVLRISMDFEGSGHDEWNGLKPKVGVKKKKTIEDRVRVIEKQKVVSRTFPMTKQ